MSWIEDSTNFHKFSKATGTEVAFCSYTFNESTSPSNSCILYFNKFWLVNSKLAVKRVWEGDFDCH